MWADALCINHADIAERGHQVGMMAALYSPCSWCIIWLGEEEDYPLNPWDVFEQSKFPQRGQKRDISTFGEYLANKETTKLLPIKQNIELDWRAESWLDVKAGYDLAKMPAEDANRHLYELPFYGITELPHFRVSMSWENAWLSLLNIIGGRPWWRRTWTVQEAVLPKSAIVQLATIQSCLKYFSAASIFYAHD